MACKRMIKPRRMSAGGILKSTASGASTGSVAGPYGAIAGAVIGLGKGIIDHSNEQDLIKEQEDAVRKQQFIQKQQGFNSTLEAQPANIPLLPFGGAIPYGNETVELESGEPFMDPNGNINSIPNDAPTHAQGGVPITLANGTQVLGKLKNAEGKQFKAMGRKLEMAQGKYIKALQNNPTSIASKTAEKMLDNIQRDFDDLFIEQETVKGSGQNGNMKFPNGGKIPGEFAAQETYNNYRPSFIKNQQYGDFEETDHGDLLKSIPLYSPGTKNVIATENYYKGVPGPQYGLPTDTEGARVESYLTKEGKTRYAGSETPVKFAQGGMSGLRKGQFGITAGEPLSGSNQGYEFGIEDPLYTANQPQLFQTAAGGTPTDIIPKASEMIQPQTEDTPTGFNIGNIATTAASLAPAIYNIGQGLKSSEQLDPREYYNPYEAGARSTMRQRRYNIQPELEANRLAQATYYRNLRETAPSQSQYLGGLQAGAIGKSRADAAAIARQQNINNQYLAEQARLDTQLGQQRAQTKLGVEHFNLQSEAARRGMIGTGLTQVSQFAQNQQVMNNQILRDAQRMGLLEDLVANYSFTDGKWKFKATGQEQSPEDIMKFIKGRK